MSANHHKLRKTDDAAHSRQPSADEPEDEELDARDDPGESEEEEEEEDVAVVADDGDIAQASLEELLAQRAAKRALDDPDDNSDIMSLSSEIQAAARERLPTKVAPVKERQEFVCKRCHLVKPRVQLADLQRTLCRDCV